MRLFWVLSLLLVLTSCVSTYRPNKEVQGSTFVLLHSTGGDPPIASVVSVYDAGTITLQYGRLYLATLSSEELDTINMIKEDPAFQEAATAAKEENCIECEELHLGYTHNGDEYSYTIPMKNVTPELEPFLRTIDSIAKVKFGHHYHSIFR